MENPTPFDLNEAIRRWQQKLSVSPAFAGDDSEELATHLRASALALAAKGLSEEEAFLVALRRLGDPLSLEQEYAKVNADSVWLTRGIWMLVGIVSFKIIGSLSSAASLAVMLLLHFCLPSGLQFSGGAWRGVIGLAAEGLLIVLALRTVKTRWKTLAQWFRRSARPTLVAILGLVLVAVGIDLLVNASFLVYVRYNDVYEYNRSLRSWHAYFTWPVEVLFPPFVLGLLLRWRFGQNLRSNTSR